MAGAGGGGSGGAERVAYRTNAFRWSMIESSDYREYIANLRGIGCPERAHQGFHLDRCDAALTRPNADSFTGTGVRSNTGRRTPNGGSKGPEQEERDRGLAQIDKDLPAVLRELLGVNYEQEVNKYFVDTEEDDQRLSFLSDNKRRRPP